MRVLHLTTEFPPVIYGGLGTAVGGLVNAWARAGMSAGVLLIGVPGQGGYGRPVTRTHPVGGPAPAVSGIRRNVALFQTSWDDAPGAALRLVESWRPDVVHLHAFWAWPIARRLREQTRVPLVYTVHSLDRAEYDLGEGPPECLTQWATQREVIAAAQRVIALSRSEWDLLAYYCPEARGRVRIVGNGIDDTATARQVVCDRRQKEAPLVLYSGRFVERKGIRELLEAIPMVLERAPATRFVLAGGHRNCSGEEMEHWWLPPVLWPFRRQIHFAGWLPPHEIAAWYRAADILIVPSWYEPFGMVILEGMLYGLPIAAANVGGPAEILEHERTGLLFPARDAAALAHTLLRLVTDPVLCRQIGLAAAHDVRCTWLWPRIVEKMRCVYHEVIATGPPLDATSSGW
jgi:glycogen synthase